MPKKRSLTETILHAIEASGETRYAIAKATGLSQSALSRFVHGERGLGLRSLEKLLDHLGLEIRPKKGN